MRDDRPTVRKPLCYHLRLGHPGAVRHAAGWVVAVPTLNRHELAQLRQETPTRWQWLVMLGIPALAALGVVFVLVLQWLGEL